MMETQEERLNNLFKKWESEYEPYHNNFKCDGINDPSLFVEQKRNKNAVLFIAKEPNNKGKEKETGDFREWWKKPLEFSFSMRLAEWSYGMVNGFPKYEDAVKNRKVGLMSVAFMNMKKSGGKGSTVFKDFMKVVMSTKDRIHEEIEIIDPDIIVGCGLYNTAWNEVFGIEEWKESGYGKNITRWKNVRIINYYHPSNRFPGAMNYALLGQIYQSKAFKGL